MLFDPTRHEPLCGTAWNTERALEAIRAIVLDTERHRTGEGHWPVHPRDVEGEEAAHDERREVLYERCVHTLRVMARRESGCEGEGDAVNWPPATYTPRPGGPSVLVQWCHGAPGFVTALADFPAGRSAEMDAMLSGAGHTVWRAGPLNKGSGLCHGTAGNGYAFLKLFERTGDEAWLQRARAFAMHAIGQCERARQQHGRGRFSLWTGDLGLAVYLWHCIQGQAEMPGLDAVV